MKINELSLSFSQIRLKQLSQAPSNILNCKPFIQDKRFVKKWSKRKCKKFCTRYWTNSISNATSGIECIDRHTCLDVI